MFGSNLRMNPLAVRKRLLLAESELNRARLARDMSTLTTGVRRITDRTKAIHVVALSAAGLIAGLAAVQRGNRLNAGGKSSRLEIALRVAGFISSFWLACRTRGDDPER